MCALAFGSIITDHDYIYRRGVGRESCVRCSISVASFMCADMIASVRLLVDESD
jgi:hypothetical protein